MKLWTIFTASVLLLNVNVNAMDKVVYGEDNRLDIFEVTNPLHLKLAKSTAGMVSTGNLQEISSDTYKLTGSKLKVCSDEKFNGQVTSASCSGFLVEHNDKQYMVTAGHCVTSQSACKRTAWVFDFAKTSENQTEYTVPKSSVYTCSKLVERKLISSTQDDYAVIELDRVVTDREALTFRKSGDIQVGEEILVIGHPTGLPTKVADDAFVRTSSNDVYFVANLDTFAGNSGSAVFNATSGEVEGILVRGHTDYTWRRGEDGKSCQAPVYCGMEECRGEDVTKITSIDFFRN
ncbi:trypsin [Bacteriovorax sp. BSW11_IV]|uniref:trypsin-like serine peptidase n=1 Tax=Bacteriovorax sp. BSW11_IV TaxID=1353529 RepID=UPI000389F724|nr:serine protease [Bacteriovorax sp. BSW11_IV]EQC42993.1 trypsin [Bacteriovorax sp. BSW11_IV]